MTIYISGPMAGLEDLGRAAFAAEERFIRTAITPLTGPEGLAVINPACLPLDLPETAYMPICMAMLREADGIWMMEGWEKSPGARLEKEYAEYLRLMIMDLGHGCSYRWDEKTGTYIKYTDGGKK